ncbi:MAG: hypothetical protein IJW33_01765, partial [Lentisphaeria bacterium]|nr:hypothetical protein [Lentisphaeria bacterium]
HPLSGKLNLCKSRKANSTPRLAWRHGIGGKRAAPGKLRLRLRWAQGMVSVCPLWLAGVVLAAAANVPRKRQRKTQRVLRR